MNPVWKVGEEARREGRGKRGKMKKKRKRPSIRLSGRAVGKSRGGRTVHQFSGGARGEASRA